MSTSWKHRYLAFSFVLANGLLIAQSSYQLGTLPSVNVNQKLKNEWSINMKVEARQIYQKGVFSEHVDPEFNYQLTDISCIGAKKLGFNSRIGAGYLIRFREGEIVHRVIQQFTYTKKYDRFKLSHRVMTDQTFSSSRAPDFRLRYRISTEIPLSGASTDPREFYLKINNEYLNNVQQLEYGLEIRIIPMLGFSINKHNKLEFGLDYRINSFIDQPANNNFWLAVNWFIEL